MRHESLTAPLSPDLWSCSIIWWKVLNSETLQSEGKHKVDPRGTGGPGFLSRKTQVSGSCGAKPPCFVTGHYREIRGHWKDFENKINTGPARQDFIASFSHLWVLNWRVERGPSCLARKGRLLAKSV